MQRLIFMIACCLLSISAFSTHIYGGYMTYECLGSDNYKVIVYLYRDANPATNTNNAGNGFSNTILIGAFNSGANLMETGTLNIQPGSFDIISPNISNPCMQIPEGIMIQKGVYIGIINLPPIPGGYDLVYQRCCRGTAPVNIVNPGSRGISLTEHIPDVSLAVCNNSCYFVDEPPIVMCINEPLQFSHTAFDPDGDQIVYEICEVLNGGSTFDPVPQPANYVPWTPIPWTSGYSTTNQLGSMPNLTIDPVTGFLSGYPNLIGKFAIGICAKEYRAGVLINTHRRDFHYVGIPCEPNFSAIIEPQSESAIYSAGFENGSSFCHSLTLSPVNQSINGTNFFWDFGDPNSTSDTSTLVSPSYTYHDSGTFNIMLIINPGYPCADTSWETYTLYPPIVPSFDPIVGQCVDGNLFTVQGGGEFGEAATFLWDFENTASPPTSDSLGPVQFSYPDTGHYEVSLTIFENGCDSTVSRIAIVYPKPVANFSIPGGIACVPYNADFSDLSIAWTPISYEWDFGDGTTSTLAEPSHEYTEVGEYIVSLRIQVTEGCPGIDTVISDGPIQVHPIPTAGFYVTPKEAWIFEPEVWFTDESWQSLQHFVSMGNGDTLTDRNFEYSYPDHGYWNITQIVYNEFGCPHTETQTVYIRPEYLFYAPNAFTPDGNGLNELWQPHVDAVAEYHLMVFNRWGEMVWDTYDPKAGWNGIKAGGNQLAQIGVFVYRADILDVHKETHVELGHFSVLR